MGLGLTLTSEGGPNLVLSVIRRVSVLSYVYR